MPAVTKRYKLSKNCVMTKTLSLGLTRFTRCLLSLAFSERLSLNPTGRQPRFAGRKDQKTSASKGTRLQDHVSRRST